MSNHGDYAADLINLAIEKTKSGSLDWRNAGVNMYKTAANVFPDWGLLIEKRDCAYALSCFEIGENPLPPEVFYVCHMPFEQQGSLLETLYNYAKSKALRTPERLLEMIDKLRGLK